MKYYGSYEEAVADGCRWVSQTWHDRWGGTSDEADFRGFLRTQGVNTEPWMDRRVDECDVTKATVN